MDFPGKNTGVGWLFPSPGDLPDPGIKLCISCVSGWILYHWATREAQIPYIGDIIWNFVFVFVGLTDFYCMTIPGLSMFLAFSSVQFSSVAQSCPTLCDPMNCSTPGLPVHHQLPEFPQTHVHWVGDAKSLYVIQNENVIIWITELSISFIYDFLKLSY